MALAFPWAWIAVAVAFAFAVDCKLPLELYALVHLWSSAVATVVAKRKLAFVAVVADGFVVALMSAALYSLT